MKKKLKKYQTGETVSPEEQAFLTDSMAIDTNAQLGKLFYDKYNISGQDEDYKMSGDTRISNQELNDFYNQRKIMNDAAESRRGDLDFWTRFLPNIPDSSQQIIRDERYGGEMKHGGSILGNVTSAFRGDWKLGKKK